MTGFSLPSAEQNCGDACSFSREDLPADTFSLIVQGAAVVGHVEELSNPEQTTVGRTQQVMEAYGGISPRESQAAKVCGHYIFAGNCGRFGAIVGLSDGTHAAVLIFEKS